jgi:hypothetical protein
MLTVQAPAASGAVVTQAKPASGDAIGAAAGAAAQAEAEAEMQSRAPRIAATLTRAPLSAALPTFALAFLGMFGIFAVAQKQNQSRPAFARRANLVRSFLASAAIAAVLVTASCAGYITEKTPPPTSTNYTVTVTATSGSLSHSSQFTLTVTQ